MKIKTILALSLLANLFLIIQWVRLGNWAQEDRNAAADLNPPSEAEEAAPAAAQDKEVPATDMAAESVPSSDIVFNWETLESEDYLTYIDNLRRIGCPEETIADIIKADVGKMFKQRREDILASLPEPEYWTNSSMGGFFTGDDLKTFRQLEEEKQAVLKTLLGSQYTPGTESTLMSVMADPQSLMQRSLGFLPEGKSLAVTDIYRQMQEEMVQLAAENQSGGAVDMRMMSDLMEKRDQRLSELLTPEEKFEVDLRMSELSQTLRHRIGGMEPSEQEFRDIFALQQKIYEENQVDLYSSNRDSMERRSAADQQLSAELRNVLGEDRYKDYTLAQDYQFQELNRIARNTGMEREAAVQAYDIQKSAQEAFRQLQSQPGITAESMNEAAGQIYAETAAALQDKLGAEGWEQFENSPSAYWLERMKEPRVRVQEQPTSLGVPQSTAQPAETP